MTFILQAVCACLMDVFCVWKNISGGFWETQYPGGYKRF